MDWKEKGLEASYLGVLAVIGTWLVKKFKPFTKWASVMYKLSERTDILEKKEKKNEVRVDVLENFIKATLDLDSDATYLTDESGEVTYVNTEWLNITGLPNAESAYGFGYMSVIPEEDKQRIQHEHDLFQKHPNTRYNGTVRFQHYETKIITEYNCKSIPVFDYENNIKKTIGRIYVIEI